MRQTLFDAAFLLGAFAGSALALAMAGAIGVFVAYWVREFWWELRGRQP